jgi:hypothetical protein
VSVEDIRGIRAIRGQILFEFDLPSSFDFRISFEFRISDISDFSGAWWLEFGASRSLQPSLPELVVRSVPGSQKKVHGLVLNL